MHRIRIPDTVRAQVQTASRAGSDLRVDVKSNQSVLDPFGPTPSQLLDALLYSVSHDLRSPLLTMTLSADLIEEGLDARHANVSSDNAAIGLAALRQGAADLDRMLEALTQLSRARRRELTPARAPLQMVLSDYTVIVDSSVQAGGALSSDALSGGAKGSAVPNDLVVLADAIAVREFIDIVAGDQPIEIVVRAGAACVELDMPTPQELHAGGSPLDLLVSSLQQFAGTQVQALAVQQVVLNRQGVEVRGQEGRLLIDLPVGSR